MNEFAFLLLMVVWGWLCLRASLTFVGTCCCGPDKEVCQDGAFCPITDTFIVRMVLLDVLTRAVRTLPLAVPNECLGAVTFQRQGSAPLWTSGSGPTRFELRPLSQVSLDCPLCPLQIKWICNNQKIAEFFLEARYLFNGPDFCCECQDGSTWGSRAGGFVDSNPCCTPADPDNYRLLINGVGSPAAVDFYHDCCCEGRTEIDVQLLFSISCPTIPELDGVTIPLVFNGHNEWDGHWTNGDLYTTVRFLCVDHLDPERGSYRVQIDTISRVSDGSEVYCCNVPGGDGFGTVGADCVNRYQFVDGSFSTPHIVPFGSGCIAPLINPQPARISVSV